MTMKYVRNFYGVPAYRGGRVTTTNGEEHGTITSASHYIRVRIDGEAFSRNFHPLELQYEPIKGKLYR